MNLHIQCRDEVGLVARVTGILAHHGMNITSLREYVDTENRVLFSRFVCEGDKNIDLIEAELKDALPDDALIRVNPQVTAGIAVMVTKEYHCLSDILIRNHYKTLGANVDCVIGNHAELGDLCVRFGVPYHYITHEGKSKDDFEQEIFQLINSYQVDFIVLAKFMRILSPWFVDSFKERIINIHHSFLPAFIGASPYRQAFERGVKLIGATAHFVTNDLDDGPIIVQQTIRVNHTFTVADMVRAGREIETAVLAKALLLVFAHRVFVSGNKTIVFET